MINSGVVAAVYVAGDRGDPCGVVHQKGHHDLPLHILLPQHRNWSSGF